MNRTIPNIGEPAPDFLVMTAAGQRLQLKTVLSDGRPLMLVFYRGHW